MSKSLPDPSQTRLNDIINVIIFKLLNTYHIIKLNKINYKRLPEKKKIENYQEINARNKKINEHTMSKNCIFVF